MTYEMRAYVFVLEASGVGIIPEAFKLHKASLVFEAKSFYGLLLLP